MATTTNKRSNSSGGVPSRLREWPESKLPGKSGPPRSRRRHTRGKRGKGKSSGPGSRGPARNRREETLRRLDVDPEVLAASPQVTPLLRQNGIRPQRLVEILRCDDAPESRAFVVIWDKLTPAARNSAGVEGMAMAAGMTPRRLWEVFSGAALMQSKETVGVTIALALPGAMRMTVKEAMKAKGHFAREHLFKASRVLPTPKGTIINLPGEKTQKQLEEPEDEGDFEGLAPADEFLLKASKAMNPKALPSPVAPVEETDEDDEDEDA